MLYLDYQTNHMQKCHNLDKRDWLIVTMALDKESQLKYNFYLDYRANNMQKCHNLDKRDWSIVTVAMDKASQLQYNFA